MPWQLKLTDDDFKPIQPTLIVDRVEWDGRDEQGRALAEGLYFYTLATAEGRWMKRMTLLR